MPQVFKASPSAYAGSYFGKSRSRTHRTDALGLVYRPCALTEHPGSTPEYPSANSPSTPGVLPSTPRRTMAPTRSASSTARVHLTAYPQDALRSTLGSTTEYPSEYYPAAALGRSSCLRFRASLHAGGTLCTRFTWATLSTHTGVGAQIRPARPPLHADDISGEPGAALPQRYPP
jgi:hypothetical protein